MGRILLFIITLAVAGCTTPYQPFEFFGTGGYTDEKISDDSYRVTFYGNRVTSPETVHKFLFYRTAEITLENGFDYFRVVSKTGGNPMFAAMGAKYVTEGHIVKLYKEGPDSFGPGFVLAKGIIDGYGPFVHQQANDNKKSQPENGNPEQAALSRQ